MLREQFFDDPEDPVDKVRECAMMFSERPSKAVAEMLLALHNLKGSAQVVGFLHFAERIHKAEDAVGALRGVDKDHALLGTISTLLCKVSEDLENSFLRMKESHDDCLESDPAFLQCLSDLSALAVETKKTEKAVEKTWGFFEDSKKAPAKAAWGLFDEDEDAEAHAQPEIAEAVSAVPARPLEAAAPAEVPKDSPAAPAPEKNLKVSEKPELSLAPDDAPPQDMKFLLMEQAQQFFAVRIADVKEIISGHLINPLPDMQSGLKGMIVVRDRTLPVLDLDVIFGGTSSSSEDRNCAVICENSEQSFAFRVEKPRQVISLGAGDFESVENKFGTQHKSNVIKKVARYNGKSVLVIDLQVLLKAG